MSKFLADALAAYTERPDISGVIGSVEQLLDESVAAQEYLIPDSDAETLTVGALAAGLDLMLPAVSGVLTDQGGLDHQAFLCILIHPGGRTTFGRTGSWGVQSAIVSRSG